MHEDLYTQRDQQAEKSLLLSALSMGVFAGAAYLSSVIFRSFSPLWPSIVLMLIALVLHFTGKKHSKNYLISLGMNSVANGMAVAAYYCHFHIPLQFRGLLLGLAPTMLLLLLCYFLFGIVQKRKALSCAVLLLVNLLLTGYSLVQWVKTGELAASFGFFSSIFSLIYIVCFVLAVYGKASSAPKVFSIGSFGIYGIIGTIVGVIITEGEALEFVFEGIGELISELFSFRKNKKLPK